MALSVDPQSAVPLQRQLYVALREGILAGRLAPGTRLPGSRALATTLEVSRTTVALVFDQLRAEGYVLGRERSGTFVARVLPDAHLRVPRNGGLTRSESDREPEMTDGSTTVRLPAGEDAAGSSRSATASSPTTSRRGERLAALSISSSPLQGASGARAFRLGTPALDLLPLPLWGRLLARRWRRLTAPQLAYAEPYGAAPLREAIADYVREARAVACDASQVIVVSGAQQAFDLCARVLLDPGDLAAVEDPGYRGARAALAAADATLAPIPVDHDGLQVDALDALPVAPRLACVTPSHQFPLGVTLSAARRLALLSWAARTGGWIVEDDFDSEYRFRGRPLPSLQGMDREGRVVYVGTFSKTLFPALRLGYLIAPPALVEAFARARATVDRHPSSLEQLVLADFIGEGHFARHVRRMRAIYAERQETLLRLLRERASSWLEVESVDAGMHLVGWLPAHVEDARLAALALERGVVASPLSTLSLVPRARGALLLGFAGFDALTMTRALDTLRTVAREAGVAGAA